MSPRFVVCLVLAAASAASPIARHDETHIIRDVDANGFIRRVEASSPAQREETHIIRGVEASGFIRRVEASPIIRRTEASPIARRKVDELNEEAFAEAHQRDDTATRAFSDIQITTSDGKCLSVDKLSGDFRANLTPVQVVDCGSTDGEGWDIITSGVHNDRDGQALVVSTLTQACLNFDPRRAAGNQVLLFSCGGRAAGEGKVTDSQLFAFDGASSTIALQPANAQGQCVTSSGGVLDIATCDDGSQDQSFTFGGASSAPPAEPDQPNDTNAPQTPSAIVTPPAGSIATPEPVTTASADVTTASNEPAATTTAAPSGIPSVNPTTTISVSRDGLTLNPSAAAEAHQFDSSAERPVQSVNIRAPDGRCLSVDSSAGDFRENLIPVGLVKCAEVTNQKFDLITKGKHNDGQKKGRALISSVLMNGCLSFDNRREKGDTVTIFSCGGRADGGKSSSLSNPAGSSVAVRERADGTRRRRNGFRAALLPFRGRRHAPKPAGDDEDRAGAGLGQQGVLPRPWRRQARVWFLLWGQIAGV